jgi:hypothetical protein
LNVQGKNAHFYPNVETESATGIMKRRIGMAETTRPLDGEGDLRSGKPDKTEKSPRLDIETPTEKKARRAEALRANLRRRKDQKRARVSGAGVSGTQVSEDP